MKHLLIMLLLSGCAITPRPTATRVTKCGLRYTEVEFRSAVEQAIDNALAWLPTVGRDEKGDCQGPPCFQSKDICDKLAGWEMVMRYDIDKDGTFEWRPAMWAYGVTYYQGPKARTIEIGPQAFYTGSFAHEILHVAEQNQVIRSCDPTLKYPDGGEDCEISHLGWYSRGAHIAAFEARVRR